MTGMAIGAVAVPAGMMLMKKKGHNMQKGPHQAVKAVGDFVSGIQTMMK